MKPATKVIAASALVSVASAAGGNIFAVFGSCQYEDCGNTAASCCTFVARDGSTPGQQGDFCMSNAQRGGSAAIWQGSYKDSTGTTWGWTCPQDARPSVPVPLGGLVATPYAAAGTEWVEWLIGVMFLSGSVWVLGLPVYGTLGSVVWGFYIAQSFTALYRFYMV